ncbi:unnamed protein product [Vicia faba]|uniref:Uncharacterized protein n=1 Tax=Vicia faba TaxID=3906 RepID=A0AAV1A8Y4_VICFA|nr:unnamed protein product [Vicia faba]
MAPTFLKLATPPSYRLNVYVIIALPLFDPYLTLSCSRFHPIILLFFQQHRETLNFGTNRIHLHRLVVILFFIFSCFSIRPCFLRLNTTKNQKWRTMRIQSPLRLPTGEFW